MLLEYATTSNLAFAIVFHDSPLCCGCGNIAAIFWRVGDGHFAETNLHACESLVRDLAMHEVYVSHLTL